ncbi:helix-turn-helix transcriptional regulator, partial [bacterium]|nr:helix-turn-helix transcriptional regulator [bacterium]
HIVIPPREIVVRMSSDFLAVSNEQVAAALRYIGEHAADNMSIADVAHATGVSRSHLARRFRDCLGCSMKDEIQRHRVLRVMALLIETDLSVHKIAAQLGFRHVTNLCNFFSTQTGMSPGAWRKSHRNADGEQKSATFEAQDPK